MDFSYKNKRIQRLCEEERFRLRELGKDRAETLAQRCAELSAAETLAVMRTLPGHCHELTGDRAGEIAISLNGLNRLIFVPHHDPLPLKEDGGLDWSGVTAIRILEIVDYHV